MDFQKIFESAPGLFLLLSPGLEIIGASDAYIGATLTKRHEITGRGLFEVFPDNPDDPLADGVSNLKDSLEYVLLNKVAHAMPVQKYDIRKPDGSFEERYWSPLNTPVLNDQNQIELIIHKVEDVTELVHVKQHAERTRTEHSRNLKDSEDRFHRIFNFSPVAICMAGLSDGKLMYVNNAFERLLHISAADAIGKSAVQLGMIGEQVATRITDKAALQHGILENEELDVIIGNGELRKMLLSVELITLDGGSCIVSAMVDITERKKMEEQIIELKTGLEKRVAQRTAEIISREKRFRALVERNVDMMMLIRPDGGILYVSPSLNTVLGYNMGRSPVNNAINFIHEDDRPAWQTEIAGISATPGTSVYLQHRLLHKSGNYLVCEGTVTNMLDDPDIGALILNFRDITARKEAEEAVRDAETNYHEIFDKANDAIYVHDIHTGRILEVNNKASEITGFSREEILTSDPEIFITDNPDYTSEHAFSYIQKAAGGTPQIFEWLGKTKDGSQMWFEVNLKMATIAGKERILAFFHEISDRKKKEQEINELNQTLEFKVSERTMQLEENIRQLAESEEKFHKAFHASAAGISITRLSDSVFIDVNDAFLALTGYSKSELIGNTSASAGLVTDVAKREEVMKQVREQGVAKYFEITVRHKSGQVLDVLASIETITLGGEKFAINIIYDITERKRVERNLKMANEELESFTYSVSHDLRAPLRAITGFAKILKDDYTAVLDAEGERLLSTISRNAEKMGTLIDDLLSFARLSRKEVKRQETNMTELVSSVVSELKRTFGYSARVEVGELHIACTDPALMRQVLINLLGNAMKYSSKVEAAIVEVKSISSGDEIIYTVADNGVGFDMKYVDKLFGVFQRLHTSDEFEGIGVGLAIVKRIINKHGGKVWAEGVPEGGAKFHFSLPAHMA